MEYYRCREKGCKRDVKIVHCKKGGGEGVVKELHARGEHVGHVVEGEE